MRAIRLTLMAGDTACRLSEYLFQKHYKVYISNIIRGNIDRITISISAHRECMPNISERNNIVVSRYRFNDPDRFDPFAPIGTRFLDPDLKGTVLQTFFGII